jgi:putative hydrolase of the HAD superfamily
VLFDLFGTLIAPFRMREHRDVIRDCADLLGIGFDDCHRGNIETFPQRIRGEFATMGDNFDWIMQQLGHRATDHALAQAVERYEQFTIASLVPVAGALDLLEWLTSRGVQVGLVTNCAPDIPHVWGRSAFAPYFNHCAFSCEVGAVKPDPAIYRAALDALNLQPAKTLYVGDGSDEELSGAARCGLNPVLISVDLSNTYDAQRVDVDEWTGAVIHSLSELPRLVDSIERASRG